MSQTTRLRMDSDVDLHVARQRREMLRAPWSVLGAISVGGALGALGRSGLATAWAHSPGQFPWATSVTNISGCFLIGFLMVLITEVWSAHRLIRPFLGVGVLGGYTTSLGSDTRTSRADPADLDRLVRRDARAGQRGGFGRVDPGGHGDGVVRVGDEVFGEAAVDQVAGVEL